MAPNAAPGSAPRALPWYLHRPTGAEGPLSLRRLRERVRDGSVAPHDQVWSPGMPDWSMIEHVRAITADYPVENARTSSTQRDRVRAPASHRARLGAFSLDALLVAAATAAVVVAMGAAGAVVTAGRVLAVAAVVFVAFGTLCEPALGATPGKRAMRLEVVGPDLRRVTLARALWRNVARVVLVPATGLLELLAAAVRDDRRTGHDLATGTSVVRAPKR